MEDLDEGCDALLHYDDPTCDYSYPSEITVVEKHTDAPDGERDTRDETQHPPDRNVIESGYVNAEKGPHYVSARGNRCCI